MSLGGGTDLDHNIHEDYEIIYTSAKAPSQLTVSR